MNKPIRFFALFLFAAVTRVLFFYFFPLHGTDYDLVQTAGTNLLNGYGMGFQRSPLHDLSAFHFEGLRLWPPLLILTTALANDVTGNPIFADTLLMSITFVGLLWAVYHLSKLIGLREESLFIVFLFLALNPEIIKQPGLSDMTAAFFCVWAILETARYLKGEKKKNIRNLLFVSLLFFLPSAFRYQYYPVSLLFPAYILIVGLFLKKNVYIRLGFFSLVFVLAFLFAQELTLYFYTAQPLNRSVAMDDTGFFLSNLTEFYPIFTKVFLNSVYLENRIVAWMENYRPISTIYLLFNFLLFTTWVLLIIVQKRKAAQKANRQTEHITQHLILTLVLTVLLAIVFILIALSVTHSPRRGIAMGWTYVMDGRYYIVPSILVLLLTVWQIQQNADQLKARLRRLLKLTTFLILLFNGLLTLSFYYNMATGTLPAQKKKGLTERKKIEQYIQQKVTGNNALLVLSTDDDSKAYFPFHPTVAVTQRLDVLTKNPIHSSKPVTLLLIESKRYRTEQVKEFINRTNAIEVFQSEYSIIHSLEVKPDQQH